MFIGILENVSSLIADFWKMYRKFIGWIMVFAIVLYFPLMSNQLVNCYDGIWEGTYHKAGAWELSLGRWFWLYIDRIRFGISFEPLVSLITLICYAVGFSICAELVSEKISVFHYVAAFLFLANTSVCVTLSYRFMSPTFGLAFLLSVLGVWICEKMNPPLVGMLCASVVLCFSLGAYQAFLGCMCLLLSCVTMYKIQCGEKDVWKPLVRGIFAIILACLEYMLVWSIHLRICGVVKSTYAGANGYGLWNTIVNLPERVVSVWKWYFLYFKQAVIKTVYFGSDILYPTIFLLILCLLVIKLISIFRDNKINAIIYLLLFLGIPFETSAVLLVATDTHLSPQMTGSYALLLPMLLILLKNTGKLKVWKFLRGFVVVISCVLLYASILQIVVDQKTMYETKISSTNIVVEIHTRLGAENLLSEEYKYCFLGVPAGNEMYYRSETFWKANGYAYVGGGWTNAASLIIKAWRGLIYDICQYNLQLCTPLEYDTLLQTEEVKEMPVFPNAGSIQKLGDIVVIKVN